MCLVHHANLVVLLAGDRHLPHRFGNQRRNLLPHDKTWWMLSLEVPGMWHCDDEEVTILHVLPSLAICLTRFLTGCVNEGARSLMCAFW